MHGNTMKSLAMLVAVLALPLIATAQNNEEVVPGPAEGTALQPDPIAPEEAATDTGETIPAEQAQGRALRAQVQSVQGMVQYRESPEGEWKKATPGLELGPGAEFRTGLRSAVRLLIDEHQITIDRLGVVSLLQAVENSDGVIKTNLGMKYGRTEYKVEAGAAEHESTISAPGMTLAIRSSDTVMGFDAAFGGAVVVVDSPRSQVNNRRQKLINLTNGRLDEDDRGPGENALGRNTVEAFHAFGATPEDAHDGRHLPGYEYIRRSGDLAFRQQITGSETGVFTPNFRQLQTDLSPISFRVFDLGVEDGDVVNVWWNNHILASGVELTSEGAGLSVTPGMRQNVLSIEAAQFGSDNELTAGLELPEGGAVFNLSFPKGRAGAVQHIEVLYTGELDRNLPSIEQ